MIVLKDLGKEFSGNWIFRGLNLRVKKGESFVVLGPSGSGKSTLLKLVAGLLTPDEGSTQVNSPELGMLFQKNALFDSLSILDNLLFPLKEKKGMLGAEALVRAKEMLGSVGLQGTENLFPDEISGGMQKRLGIARALIIEPEVILYDDPTAGLDPITSRTIAELILRLKKERGSTVLSITNDIRRAYQLGDRIALLAQGKLTEGGTPEQVQETRDPALKQFITGNAQGPLT